MFDKNTFKVIFRNWAEHNMTANEDIVKEFCQENIPASVMLSNYWLVEQSVQWFNWMKSRRAPDYEEFGADEEYATVTAQSNQYLC